MNWYLKVLKDYVNFQGRARRKEYWMYVLISIPIILVLYLLESLIGINGVLTFVYSLAVLLPGLGVIVRRLHDTDRSGWWILIGLVPFVGSIILIVFLCLEGTPGDNRFGSNPKQFA
ncbi:DUF805 domain-containing protein [Paenibacillus hunanensis]|uniref:Uncharacterized membrane protein YhaH (DUF805 family) n=1 Tax=Paenibacillus hunanensis TaxID=539262 RepID=A0ABU1IWM6_9BACL|nr:DUF805 domain-containing protein [Paenibacillus hunanensis]MDR6243660.1 uncharacterized membrane protein YhaH (DUF805 family) [Paenibacillus hunanensis]GGJ23730.1 DUF805 domain-containing protein [Paenibacillus hunanensis]